MEARVGASGTWDGHGRHLTPLGLDAGTPRHTSSSHSIQVSTQFPSLCHCLCPPAIAAGGAGTGSAQHEQGDG